jgi:hypothetical protein
VSTAKQLPDPNEWAIDADARLTDTQKQALRRVRDSNAARGPVETEDVYIEVDLQKTLAIVGLILAAALIAALVIFCLTLVKTRGQRVPERELMQTAPVRWTLFTLRTERDRDFPDRTPARAHLAQPRIVQGHVSASDFYLGVTADTALRPVRVVTVLLYPLRPFFGELTHRETRGSLHSRSIQPMLQSNVDVKGALSKLDLVARETPFAMARALTLTAQQAKEDIVTRMVFDFDRPTPYTLNSLYIKPATKADLRAQVYIKTDAAKGTPAVKYLAPEVYGGARHLKRSERALMFRGMLKPGMMLVPGKGVRLDQYGNISAGTIQQILARIAGYMDPLQNATPRSLARSQNKTEYFWGSPRPDLPEGVWQRLASKIKPILIAVRPAMYRERLHFYETAQRTFDRDFKANFQKSLADALASSRYR